MKKVTMTIFVLAVFTLTGFAQNKKDTEKQKPKATYQIYKKGDEWKTTNSFNETELLELKTAIDKAISEETVKVKTTAEEKK